MNADRARGRFARWGVLLSALLSIPFSAALAAVSITDISGTARVRRPNTASWNEVPVNYVLSPGDEVKTDRSSRVTITFDDASRIEIGPNSSYMLEEAQSTSSRMSLNFGKLRAWVTKASSRRFAVRTPTAVCSVRGTEFGVDVAVDGRTSVELYEGLLGVADQKGNEVLLNPGERVDVTLTGVGKKESQESKKAEESSSERATVKKEVGLEMNKEQILAAASEEIKQALYQQGKVMVDVNGNRVRIEEYILRPTPSSFKFVVLNERPDRFDYFFRTGQFNTTLPDDLSTALRQVPGCVGAACTWWLTSYQTAYSNTSDVVLEDVKGGHLVDVNNNQVAGDEVSAAFDAGANDFIELNTGTADTAVANPARNANTPFFTALYDTYDITYNGVSHFKWAPNVAAYAFGGGTGCVGLACGGIQSMANDRLLDAGNVGVVQGGACTTQDECSFFPGQGQSREPGVIHGIIFEKNGAGTKWDKYDTYVISDEGKMISTDEFASFGGTFKERLLKVNYQQIITASEFGGRKIDLVFEPKILIQSGLIP